MGLPEFSGGLLWNCRGCSIVIRFVLHVYCNKMWKICLEVDPNLMVFHMVASVMTGFPIQSWMYYYKVRYWYNLAWILWDPRGVGTFQIHINLIKYLSDRLCGIKLQTYPGTFLLKVRQSDDSVGLVNMRKNIQYLYFYVADVMVAETTKVCIIKETNNF